MSVNLPAHQQSQSQCAVMGQRHSLRGTPISYKCGHILCCGNPLDAV